MPCWPGPVLGPGIIYFCGTVGPTTNISQELRCDAHHPCGLVRRSIAPMAFTCDEPSPPWMPSCVAAGSRIGLLSYFPSSPARPRACPLPQHPPPPARPALPRYLISRTAARCCLTHCTVGCATFLESYPLVPAPVHCRQARERFTSQEREVLGQVQRPLLSAERVRVAAIPGPGYYKELKPPESRVAFGT